MDPIIYEKKGAGAYRVEIHPDAVYVWCGKTDETVNARQFRDPLHAFNNYRQTVLADNREYHICKALENHL